MTKIGLRVVTIATILVLLPAGASRGDKIVLRGGGQIKGKVLPDPSRADRVAILTEHGKTPLTFEKAKIVQVIAEPSALDEYLTRRAAASTTAQSQHDVGLWCEANKLSEFASLHFEAAVKADPTFGPAHLKLRHRQHGDRWLTQDEVKEAQGLVKYKMKWMTVAEKEALEKKSAISAEQTTMVSRFKRLRKSIISGPEDRRREADSELMALRDPLAITPLIRVFGDDPAPIRSMLARVLGVIEGSEASAALVARFLGEEEHEVRHAVLGEIKRREFSEVSKKLLGGLRSENPDIVNRAAWALATLNAIKSVPDLVNVLVQTKTQQEDPDNLVPSGGGGGSGGGFSVTRPPAGSGGRSGGVPGGSVTMPGGIASNGGVAALGSTNPDNIAGLYGNPALPGGGVPGLYGNNAGGLSTNGGNFTMGNGGRAPELVTWTIRNGEVLAALIKLTGQDFGYDTAAWKQWLRTSFRPDPTPSRRVPQP